METQIPSNSQGSAPTPPPAPAPQPPASGNTGMAILAYLGILVIIPLVSDAKNDPFVKFHAKQGLVLFIGEVIATFIVAIPVLGWILSPLIWLAAVVLSIVGIINAASGQTKELPVIGKFASNFNF